MKDIKEISLMLGVSRVTVYNHLKKLEKEIEVHSFKKKGTTYIDDEGIRLLKISMGLIEVPTIKEDISMEDIVNDISSQVLINLKDDVINQVSDNLKNDITSLVDSKMNKLNDDLERKLEILEEQNRKLVELLEEKQDKGFISRLKKLFKD